LAFTGAALSLIFVFMSKVTAILIPSPDGTLHLPLPEGWAHQRIRVTAELEPVDSGEGENLRVVAPKAGCLKGFWMAPDFDEPLEDFQEYN
jgi:hypothetical protein